MITDLSFRDTMEETHLLIFDELYALSSYSNKIKSNHFESLGIDRRLLAAHIKIMNEMYKGKFFIGSTRQGYWICKNEAEATVSLSCYSQTILSSLRERGKMKRQISETFGTIRMQYANQN